MTAGIELCIASIAGITTNATFAGVVTVVLGVLLARREYVKQKNVDRENAIKKEISDDILLLQAKLHYGIIIIDRIAYSWSITKKEHADFLKEFVQNEIPYLSKLINEEIPFLHDKIASKMTIDFSDTKDLNDTFKVWDSELKTIHDTFVLMKLDLKIRASEQPQLSSSTFDKSTKELIEVVWGSRTIYT